MSDGAKAAKATWKIVMYANTPPPKKSLCCAPGSIVTPQTMVAGNKTE